MTDRSKKAASVLWHGLHAGKSAGGLKTEKGNAITFTTTIARNSEDKVSAQS
jgi:hypothetical protein